MLSIDLAEISYEERVFISRLAVLMIDIRNPLLQSIPDQLLGVVRAIEFEFNVSILCIFNIRINACQTCCA